MSASVVYNLRNLTQQFRYHSSPFAFNRKPAPKYELKAVFQDTGLKTKHIERLGKILKELDEFEQTRH
jgi:hypothetical protein